jgi:hypothetical protein
VRTYGRDSTGTWVEITDPNYVQLATLAQVLRLQQGESPFFGNYGLPAIQSVQSQIAPQAALNRTIGQFSRFFASLIITRLNGYTQPTYSIRAVFLNGTIIQSTLAT